MFVVLLKFVLLHSVLCQNIGAIIKLEKKGEGREGGREGGKGSREGGHIYTIRIFIVTCRGTVLAYVLHHTDQFIDETRHGW